MWRNPNIESKYESFINIKVQNKYAKYVLEVHRSATNIAVLWDNLIPILNHPLAIGYRNK